MEFSYVFQVTSSCLGTPLLTKTKHQAGSALCALRRIKRGAPPHRIEKYVYKTCKNSRNTDASSYGQNAICFRHEALLCVNILIKLTTSRPSAPPSKSPFLKTYGRVQPLTKKSFEDSKSPCLPTKSPEAS